MGAGTFQTRTLAFAERLPKANLLLRRRARWNKSRTRRPGRPNFSQCGSIPFPSTSRPLLRLIKPATAEQNFTQNSQLSSGCSAAFHCRFVLAGVRLGSSPERRHRERREPTLASGGGCAFRHAAPVVSGQLFGAVETRPDIFQDGPLLTVNQGDL